MPGLIRDEEAVGSTAKIDGPNHGTTRAEKGRKLARTNNKRLRCSGARSDG